MNSKNLAELINTILVSLGGVSMFIAGLLMGVRTENFGLSLFLLFVGAIILCIRVVAKEEEKEE